MGILYHQEMSFEERVEAAKQNDFARKATAAATDGFVARKAMVTAKEPEWADFRRAAADLRAHVLDHLDFYLNQFIEQASANGSQVHFGADASEVGRTVLDIFERHAATRVVKSKSMVSEEVDINRTLRTAGMDVTETDLGEWILQLDDWDAPSHIIGPALHKDIHTIYDLFVANGYDGPKDAYAMTKFARAKLREKFLEADIGITGCNFAIAETGAVTIMTNEGNGRMVTSLPKVHIVLMGMERLVPTLSDLDVLMQVFVRSAVGTKISSYLSMTVGPRKPDEQDGPEEVHVIIIDNGRSDILAGPYKDMLRCIRCGACQNICPVYHHLTGHPYGSIYEGPMGIVLTPLLVGYEKAGDLPYVSTLCGACTDHCPVHIPLHELILQHRKDVAAARGTASAEARVYAAAGQVLAHPSLYRAATGVGAPVMQAMSLLGHRRGRLDARWQALPVLGNWVRRRNLPLLQGKKLRDVMRDNKRGDQRG